MTMPNVTQLRNQTRMQALIAARPEFVQLAITDAIGEAAARGNPLLQQEFHFAKAWQGSLRVQGTAHYAEDGASLIYRADVQLPGSSRKLEHTGSVPVQVEREHWELAGGMAP